MFQPALDAIVQYDRILIHRHSRPDGDALGSQIGLKRLILDNFPDKRVYAVGDAAGRYGFMPESVMDDVPDEAYAGALAIILDTSAKALISDGRWTLAARTARVDHHLFVEQIADTEAIDPSYESCSGMIAALALDNGLTLSPVAATALYTGMVTDSGRFRYDSVTARTFRLAAFLAEQPIDVNELYRQLYASDLSQLQLRARFALKIELTARRVAYIYTTSEEIAALNADAFAISRGMVGVMADIEGVDIWVNFTETPGGVLCELRSSRYDINPVAVRYGGGGHKMASGATVAHRGEAMRMLADLDDMIGENP